MCEWVSTKLADHVDVIHGYAFRGEFFADEPPGDILLTPGNFAIGGGFQWNRKKYYRGGEVPSDYVLSPGDILVTMTDLSKEADTLGYAAVVPDSEVRLLHNQRLGKIIVRSSDINEKFVHWLLRSPDYRNEILASYTGSTVKHTSPTKILRYEFRLPPMATQKAISATLDALDDKIKLNLLMNETLEATARMIFRNWFIDFDPTRAKMEGREPYLAPDLWRLFPDRFDDKGVPKGWVQESLHDQADWINGAAYKNMHFTEASDARPVVKIAELKNGVTSKTKWTNTALGERYFIQDRELLFSWSGNPDTSIDAFIWTGGDAWLNQHIFAVRTTGKRSNAYLYFLLKSILPDLAEIARNKQTTGLGHVTKADMQRMMVTIPPLDVFDRFNALAEPIYDRLISNLFELRRLGHIRDLLLPKLMSGEITLKDAEQTAGGAA